MAKPKRRKGSVSNKRHHARESHLERMAHDFLDHYRAKRLETAVPLAREISEHFPKAPFGWKALGTALMESGNPQEAVAPLEHALKLQPDNNEALTNLGKALQQLGRYEEAEACLNQALAGDPGNYQANMHLAAIYHKRGKHDRAMSFYDRSLESLPDATLAKMRKASLMVERREYDQALAILEPLSEQNPKAVGVMVNLANLYGSMGRFDDAESLYRRAIELDPKNWLVFSNYYFTAHYNPRHDIEALLKIASEWQHRFAPMLPPERPVTECSKIRPLRIGMISAGLKTHPVGQMILGALENLPKGHFHLYAYSDSLTNDVTARRLRPLMEKWHEVPHTSHTDLARLIRDDAIDILIDMTGHTSGSRLPVIMEEPAPLIVKWVGGLFNTTGVEAVDYLISDAVETPEGSDDYYFEKLIRLPDDYICYTPPGHLSAEPGPLPALDNGFITLGCFNNPAKINETLLVHWAELMHQLPGSRLLLKGGQYTNADYCERLHAFMERQGIDRDRVVMEGPTPHAELVATYRRVDIALDPWPYSGGLTTCEALYMGVPVVTMPGPSFAGRHSATHLVNAGLPELVANDWDEYRQRVLELAGDLESLSRIRQHLRDVLLQSPVCDGPRFAGHLTTALRAIWQRHCDGKAPAALTFNKEGEAQFEDEDAPVDIHYAKAPEDDSTFQWQFEGKLIVVDNGGQLLESDVVRQLLQKEALELIAFDPSSQALDTSLKQHKGVHYYPNAGLGDGRPGHLHACLDPALSATLPPLVDEYQPETARRGGQVLTRLPLSTIALDSIEGLPQIDWLVLDDLSDAAAILEHGLEALKGTLLVQIRVAFQPTHERQPSLDEITHWASRHGFRFYSFYNEEYRSHFPAPGELSKHKASELISADALFLPSQARLDVLSANQRVRLAFILDRLYGIQDLAYRLLSSTGFGKGEEYLVSSGLVDAAPSNEVKASFTPPRSFTPPESFTPPANVDVIQCKESEGRPKVSVICPTYNHREFIEDAIKGFLSQEVDFSYEIIIHDDASTDGTREIVEKYANLYPRLIKPILQDVNQFSKGKSPLSFAIPKASGDFVALCDGDDYWVDRKKLKKQYDFLRKNHEYVCACHDAHVIDDTGMVKLSKLPEYLKRDFTSRELMLNKCFVLTLSLMFRKVFDEVPEEIGGIVNGDSFILSMLGEYGGAKYMSEVEPAVFRLHAGSSWSIKEKSDQAIILAESFRRIGEYHRRRGRLSVACYYHEEAVSMEVDA